MEFNKEKALDGSKQLVADILLKDEQGNDIVIICPPLLNEDGSLTIICAASASEDEVIVHHLRSTVRLMADVLPMINQGLVGVGKSGKLVDLQGNVIES